MKDGRVVAERYADGYGIDTPILGFSATKSVISALTGILVRKGALTLDAARADRGMAEAPAMPGRAITVDHLLRHTAGLALGSSLQASLGVGARAGQPDEVHGIGHGRICREHRTRDAARQRLELQ